MLAEIAPDLVVGDLRVSLSVSARLAGIPYVAIANAYWSPYARRRFPLPDVLWTRMSASGGPIPVRLGTPIALRYAVPAAQLGPARNGLPVWAGTFAGSSPTGTTPCMPTFRS